MAEVHLNIQDLEKRATDIFSKNPHCWNKNPPVEIINATLNCLTDAKTASKAEKVLSIYFAHIC